MAFDNYIPRPEDIIWAMRIISLIRDGGTLAFPTTRLMYLVDHKARTLTLQNPWVLYDETDHFYNATVHRRAIATFLEIEYQVLVKE